MYRCLHLRIQSNLVAHLGRIDVCRQGQASKVWILPLIEGLEIPPDLFYVCPGGVGHPCGHVSISTFQYGIRSAGSAPPMAGSINAPISVSASSARLRESAIRDQRTTLVIPVTMFRLWQGFRHKASLLSIKQMEAGDIQMGQGGSFILGGDGSRALKVWNSSSSLVSSSAGGILSGNALLPLRYRVCQRVGRWSSCALSTKWSDEKFRMSRIPISLKWCWSGSRM